MRLTKIKLAGFKSFVDPTTLIVPGNLVGIVGPNGCGKSNIIDAVMWVLGESSAKHLRGDALTDVIFNGSNTRQPVGMASVELCFDNSDGKIGGQFANYNEISIKRQINREGISTYFLNGTRCRRRDILGLFLGTGLGPRSYAMIEQGVISRLIEAKPEELRVFIEEAAGISKFRERRRETENRMRHTGENLERLNDIREELDKQLNHLNRQARAAERYQVLKQEERQLRTEILALNWRELNDEYRARMEKVRDEETRVEQENAGLRRMEAEMEKQRDDLTRANEALSTAQSGYYQVGSEISQMEQRILHNRERMQSLQADLEGVDAAIASARTQYDNDTSRLQALTDEAGTLEPRLQGTRSDSNRAYDALNQAEQAMQGWQTEWDACNGAMADFSRQLEVDGARLEHLEAGIEDMRSRRQLLTEKVEGIDTSVLQQQLDEQSAQLQEKETSMQQRRAEFEDQQARIRKLRTEINGINDDLSHKRTEFQRLEGRIASLESLQQHAAGTDQEPVIEWLRQAGLEQAPRLARQLTVEPEWTHAVEMVLGYHLQDICVADIDQALQHLDKLQHASIGLYAPAAGAGAGKDAQQQLADKVHARVSLNGYLDGVYTAADTTQALQLRAQLGDGESVVTPDGLWMGRNWIRIQRQDEEQGGALEREQKIERMQQHITELGGAIEALETRRHATEESLGEAEAQLQVLQDALHPEQSSLSELYSSRAEVKTRLEQARQVLEQLHEELDDLEAQEQSDAGEIVGIGQRMERTTADRARLEQQRTALDQLREQHRLALEQARSRWHTTHEQSHEIALKLESISSRKASLEQAIQRLDIQLSNLKARQEELRQGIDASLAPLQELEQSLEARLRDKVAAEAMLSEARDRVQSLEADLRSRDRERLECEKHIQELRDRLEGVRMNAQETRVRVQTVTEQLQDAGHEDIEAILRELEENADRAGWTEKLESVERKIARLGPINLAAIDEFNQLSERKTYLDSQHADLTEALATLESAIKKIDRETRTRFHETFDKLNKNLQEMFPILFGGGHAYLEMTGDDLLETGVTIMARPPGKRNSTIHLLSGGEKALTAVALVFSIFKLNPAPFCILDEVDAPLDDTNVGRFSNLVKEMSREVQFVFITHNKITMEIAQQLLGVTMYEAGVSRIVSVDMEEAVEMAASA